MWDDRIIINDVKFGIKIEINGGEVNEKNSNYQSNDLNVGGPRF